MPVLAAAALTLRIGVDAQEACAKDGVPRTELVKVPPPTPFSGLKSKARL